MATLWIGEAIIGSAIVLGTTAAFASGLALPIAVRSSWQVGIGICGLLSVAAFAAWLVRLRSVRSMWTSAVAWHVTLFIGTQATSFYLLVTWLPTIEISLGVEPVTAGWHSFLYQVVGIVAGLGVTAMMRGRADHRSPYLIHVGVGGGVEAASTDAHVALLGHAQTQILSG